MVFRAYIYNEREIYKADKQHMFVEGSSGEYTVSFAPYSAQHNSPAKIASEGGGHWSDAPCQKISCYSPNVMLLSSNCVIRNEINFDK